MRDVRVAEQPFLCDATLLVRSSPDAAGEPCRRACLQFVDHPAAFSYKLPEGVGHEQGAMCEPLSVGVHAVRRAAVPPGADVAIIGSGPIGGGLSSDLCFIGCRCIHRSYDLPQ